jgi:hypothetical protein
MLSLWYLWPIPVSVHSKALVCSRLNAGIVGSNPDEGIDIRLFRFLCLEYIVTSETSSSLGLRSPTECVRVRACACA